ncbi:FCD domain-containing protein [Okibacterium endophyticum]
MPDEPRAWNLVLTHIERELIQGRLRPGDHLPGERSLAAALGVGRSSVREALRVLEVLGLIRTSTGSGPSSGAIIVAVPGGGMSALMRLQVAAQGFAVEDVVKTRVIVESAVAAELAEAFARHSSSRQDPAERADQNPPPAPHLDEARVLLDAMDDAANEVEFLALDAQFHLALAEASGNQVITATMAGLRSSIESYVIAGVPRLASWSTTSQRLRREHRGIVAAIEAGDHNRARTGIRSHIETYYAETGLSSAAHPRRRHTWFNAASPRCVTSRR